MTYLPVDVIVDQKGKQRHKIDSLNLLAYSSLLVLVLLSTWLLKRKGRLYIHETGLAIIYGLALGAALRYGGLEVTLSSEHLKDQLPMVAPADYIIVDSRIMNEGKNSSHLYAYEFRGELQKSAKLGSQISYASVDPEVFFNIILPPIVLNAGLSLKRRHFFKNIGAIFSFAFVGTTISVALIGGSLYGALLALKQFLNSPYLADNFSLSNCLYFGAIISPTDPLAVLAIFQELGVDVNLFALVFGESILNDAVSIVLTHSIDQFSIIYNRNPYYPLVHIIGECLMNFMNMLATSCCLGIIFGIITSLLTKFSKLTETPLLESALVVLMSYVSFLVAEVLDASGIVAILLCGITQAHYTINNLSFDARERIKNLFEMLTFLCENFLFIAVGVALWQRNQTWDLTFVAISFLACLLARALSVYPLTWVLNLGRRNKIPANYAHIIAWGGAARGVISYSLAARNTVGEARRIMLSTTSVIVIFSMIAVGSSVESMLRCFRIPFNETGDHGEPKHHQSELDTQDPNMITANDPSWLVRRKRLSRTISEASLITSTSCPQTPGSGNPCSPVRCSRHCSAVTPVLEIEAVYQQRSDRLTHEDGSARLHSTLHHSPLPVVLESGTDDLPDVVSGRIQETRLTCGGRENPLYNYQESQQLSNVPTIYTSPATPTQSQSTAVIARSSNTNTNSGAYDNASIVRRWRNLDNNFIKPLLTNSQPTLMETLPPTLRALARFMTSEDQLRGQRSARS